VSEPSDKPLRRPVEIGYAALDFIKADVQMCFTLASVAETAYSMGHLERGKRVLAMAEKGYSDILRMASRARMAADASNNLQTELKQLRARLDDLLLLVLLAYED
jgi:hypothetical protein